MINFILYCNAIEWSLIIFIGIYLCEVDLYLVNDEMKLQKSCASSAVQKNDYKVQI